MHTNLIKNIMKSLIIGQGEVGNSLYNILPKSYIRDIKDEIFIDNYKITPTEEYLTFKYLHICFPYTNNFVEQVKKYQKAYKPKYTIIHSTVPVGTTRKCNAYHSPVRGIHPNLEQGLKTFTKYLAPKSKKLKRYFKKAGIEIEFMNKPEETEMAKIMSTNYYAWNIIFQKEMYKLCKKYKLDFDKVYTDWNNSYNVGYIKLDKPEVIRPVLKQIDGKIGGHCLTPNTKLLKTKITNFIKKYNENL